MVRLRELLFRAAEVRVERRDVEDLLRPPEREAEREEVEREERPAARLPPLRLEDLRVEELLPDDLRELLEELLCEPLLSFGALAPCFGILAPDRRASL